MIIRTLGILLLVSLILPSTTAQGYDGLIAAPPATGRGVPKDGYGGVVTWGDAAPAASQYTSQDIYGYVQKGGAQTRQDDQIAKLKENLAKRKAALREKNRAKNLERQEIQRKEREQQQKKAEMAEKSSGVR
jgi:hypothetical protein